MIAQLSVTNSVGDTVTLPIQVEVYDGNAARPQINLSSYTGVSAGGI